MLLRRFLPTFLALGVSVVPLHAQAQGNSEFLEDAGTSCLVGGAIVGTAALLFAPAAVVTVAGTSVTLTSVSTGLLTIFGCGAGATMALVYDGYKWADDAMFGEPTYPTLYPLREQFQTDAGGISETGQ